MYTRLFLALIIFAVGCGSDPSEPSVVTRDRLPLDSIPDARPVLLADTLATYATRLLAVRTSAEAVEGTFAEIDTTLLNTYLPGAADLIDPGFRPPGTRERQTEQEVVHGIVTLDPKEEKDPGPRTVFGVDDRGTPSNEYPYTLIGKLVVDENLCTAALVGPRHILTASHCFAPTGQFERAIFIPYYYQGTTPYGYANVVYVYGQLPGNTPSDEDFAVAVLDRRLGDALGWFGWNGIQEEWFARLDGTHPDFIAAGYSVDWYDGHVMSADWGAWIYWRTGFNPYIVAHDGDAIAGASGGPLFAQFEDSSWRIVGIITAGPAEWYLPQQAFQPGYANWTVDVARFAGILEQARADYP